ncbi:uncharacterized protein LOC120087043 [Benincasa hispida]|uniref:uncharacterized protein LOC120087043 n=1 Tax=Benincasa hispida TaxID=102211 RepID=UPI0018FFDFE2|nr:uncharacterized protein LOC120087043 [Benincasa hispida]
MLQMIQNAKKLGGLQGEDPHAHLTSFVEMCNAFSLPGVTPEGIRLYFFPYTLRNKARRWAQSLEPNEINAWDQLVESTSSLETLLKHYIEKNEANKQSQSSSLRNLEVQIEQLAIELKKKTPGTLPSSLGTSGPNGKEQCQAVTLRSGKTTVPMPLVLDSVTRPVDLTINDDHSTTNKRITSSEESTSTKDESQQDSNAKSLQPPAPKTHYVKFLKDILANKRKIGENETDALTYECSALFQNNIPTKMKDPENFTLTCSIGGKEVGNALCDLGASVNLMPLSIFKKLNIGNARPTTITLQLADRSITHPEGKIEDVLMQVDKFIFPTDFIILDYEADIEVPIILGRPFLVTGRALINVQKGELTIKVNDQQVKFNVLNALKYPSDMETCQYVEELQEEHWHEFLEESEEEDFGIGAMWE